MRTRYFIPLLLQLGIYCCLIQMANAKTDDVDAAMASQDQKIAANVSTIQDMASKGDAAAEFYLSRAYSKGLGVNPDMAASLKWLAASAQQGYALAEFYMGIYLTTGTFIQADHSKAAQWYAAAAAQGIPDAQYAIGVMKITGDGVEKNEAEGVNWVCKAYKQGFAPATPEDQKNMQLITGKGRCD